MAVAATARVQFRLRTPINLIDFSEICSNGNRHRLEDPGEYELQEIENPSAGMPGAVPWLVLIKDGKATTIGTALPNWEDHGTFPESLPELAQ